MEETELEEELKQKDIKYKDDNVNRKMGGGGTKGAEK